MNSPLSLPLLEAAPAPPSTAEDASFGSLATERGHLPLCAMEVDATITGLVARVALRQTFANTLSEPLEAEYVFPLPPRAAVTRFRLQIGERVVEGVLKERGEARQEYEDALRSGHRAAIAEEDRPDVFTMRVGNILPGERATVHLELTGPLGYAHGEATFRFPLVVAPRYVPGTPLSGENVGDGVAADTDAAPDASRISPPILLPGYPNPVRLSLTVDVDPGGLSIRDPRSSLHSVVTSEPSAHIKRIELRAGERLDRDFILRFRVAEEALSSSVVLAPDRAEGASAEGGTFLLTLVPPIERTAARPRDIVFVLDRSGSMGGWKMVAARRAAARMIDTLGESDRFAVMAFDDVIEAPPGFASLELADATDRNRFRAVEYLARVDARGGTEMAPPLERAADMLAGGYADRDRVLVLVTDGQVANEDQILRSLAPRLRNVRAFALGIDKAVNAGLLGRLASLGGGHFEIVESEDRLDEVMAHMHRRIATPVLVELGIEGSGGLEIDRASIAPDRLPDLFAGAPVQIMGRYRGPARGAIRMRAADASGTPWERSVDAALAKDAGWVSSIWGRARIRDLEDRYVTRGANDATLEREIVQTSLGFGVLSRFTAFVAVDRSSVANPGGHVRSVLQPVEMPADWEMAPSAVAMPVVPMPGPLTPPRPGPTMMGATGPHGASPMRPTMMRASDGSFQGGPPSPPPPPRRAADPKLAKQKTVITAITAAASTSRTPAEPRVSEGARALAEWLRARDGDTAARRSALESASEELERLVDALRASGPDDLRAELESLAYSVAKLRMQPAPAMPVDALWQLLLDVLDRLIIGRRGGTFWK